MADIQQILECVRRNMDEGFQNLEPRPEGWVTLSNLVDQRGAPNEEARNKIVMVLAGILNEPTISTYNRSAPPTNTQFAMTSPPLNINLMVLFVANFEGKSYRDGLSAISRTISFFQQRPIFTRDILPHLDPTVDKLAFEFTNLDWTDLSHLMGLTGIKYLPAVLYRVRSVPFVSDVIQGVIPFTPGAKS